MLTHFRQLAKKSKVAVISYHIYDNWRTKRQLNVQGKVELSSGATHANKALPESLNYINQVFDDYLKYSSIFINELREKRILEIGPGDNLGVALKFLVAGAKQVVCLDKFFSESSLKQQLVIYQALREQLQDGEKQIFDIVLSLDGGIETAPQKLLSIYGTGIEEAEKALEPEPFDLIVSRAVLEELSDPDAAFLVMDRLLIPGGIMIHKIDLRDYGIFSRYKHHPLTFLTIPDPIYRLMTYDSGKPNRRLINYYRRMMVELGYDTKIFITSIVGLGSEILPHKEIVTYGIDYSDSTISLLNEIRPHLQTEFRNMLDEELMVAGIFLVARKPLSPPYSTLLPEDAAKRR